MEKAYQFNAILQILDSNPSYTMLSIPSEIIAELPENGRLRTKGTMNEAAFSLAIHGRKNGHAFFMVGSALRRAAKVKTGDWVSVNFQITDPDALELPEELEEVMIQDIEAGKIFYAMTVGTQRSLSHYVSSVKNPEIRLKRALELALKMKTEQLYLQRAKKNETKS